MINWYRESRGVGKTIYPIRVVGYIFAVLLISIYRGQIGQLGLFSYAAIVVYLIYPHIGFHLYKKNNFDSKVEIRCFVLDAFLVGIFVTLMHFSIVPSMVFLTIVFSTAIGVNGGALFLKSAIFLLLGILLSGIATGFSFEPRLSLSIEILCFIYLLVGTISRNYYDYLRSQKFISAKEKIKNQKEEIEKNLHEKEILLKEVHHRVKNNLQLVNSLFNLQLKDLEDPRAIEAIQTSKQRIKIISLVHESLYQTDEYHEIDISIYVTNIVHYIRELVESTDDPINIDTKIDYCIVDLKKAVPLGLILNEILSNAIEHAFDSSSERKKISIHIENSNHKLELCIQDNGKGFTPQQDVTQQSLGLTLINDMVRQLKGNLKIDSTDGVTYRIDLPIDT